MGLMVLVCWVTVSAAGQTTRRAGTSPTYAFVNGNWFDGKTFKKRTFFSVDGVLISGRPGHIDSTIDLTGRFIVPPFGEAHNHNVEWYGEDRFVRLRDKYLKDGIYYVKNPCNVPRLVAPLRDRINIPGSIDVVFANGGITAPGGHPVEMAKRNIERKIWVDADAEGGFYYTVENPGEFDKKWEALKKTNPDFIKTFLLYSEEYDKRASDSAYFGWKGLDPSVLKVIVEKIHRDGYRVSTHVETSMDFHQALVAGVDEINHMPGFRVQPGYAFDTYKITEADARMAARNKVVVVTTMGSAINAVVDQTDSLSVRYKEMIDYNFNILAKYHVSLAIGTDFYSQNSRYEMENIAALHLFSNLTLLKMWCETTAFAIFPHRKIGYLKDGYAANFLVLDGNPLEDLKNTGRIVIRVKEGVIIR
jgi:hypothetical protein